MTKLFCRFVYNGGTVVEIRKTTSRPIVYTETATNRLGEGSTVRIETLRIEGRLKDLQEDERLGRGKMAK